MSNPDNASEQSIEIENNYLNMESGSFNSGFFDKKNYDANSLKLEISGKDTSDLKEIMSFWDFSLSYLKSKYIASQKPQQGDLFPSMKPVKVAKVKRFNIMGVFDTGLDYFKKNYPDLLNYVYPGTSETFNDRLDACQKAYQKLAESSDLYLFLKMIAYSQGVKEYVESGTNANYIKIDQHVYRIRTNYNDLYGHFIKKVKIQHKNRKTHVEQYQDNDKKRLIAWLKKHSSVIPIIYEDEVTKKPIDGQGILFNFERMPGSNHIILDVNIGMLTLAFKNYVDLETDVLDKAKDLWDAYTTDNAIIKKGSLKRKFEYLPFCFICVLRKYFNPISTNQQISLTKLNQDLWDIDRKLIDQLKKKNQIRKDVPNDKCLQNKSFRTSKESLLEIIFAICIDLKILKSYKVKEGNKVVIITYTHKLVTNNA